MGKCLFIAVLAFLIAPAVLAVPDLEVEKIPKIMTVVSELNNGAVFDFVINNKGSADYFEIYSLLSVSMWPKGKDLWENGETRIEVRAFPDRELRKNLGLLKFQYQIKGKNSGIFKDDLKINVVQLRDVFEITSSEMHPDDTSIELKIRNKENTEIEKIPIDFDSIFFSKREELSFQPYEEKNISIKFNKELSEKVTAGQYIMSATLLAENFETSTEGLINLLEKEKISTFETSSGLIIKHSEIAKTNEGNVPEKAVIEIKKDILSRLFTINSIEPKSTERNGFIVKYTWEKTLQPGESLRIETTTNYTIPFIILLLLVIVGIIVKIQTSTALVISKGANLVRTKKGEFALKVNLHLKARKNAENIKIIDSIPGMTKLYEEFGKKPDKVDPKTRRIFWKIPHLSKGEKRVYSYIIYSKVNIIGRFELPNALAIYEHNDKVKEVLSNKAYFAAEKNEGGD
ncbi:MAG: hypothetical protein ABIG28_02610 [archaeon]